MTTRDQPEIQWIQDYKRGDVAALGQLVEYYRKPLYSFIYNTLQSGQDAEEIFQEVWLRAIKNLKNYRDKNFLGWLFRIARNYFIDRIRKDSRMVQSDGNSESANETPLIERFQSNDPTPDQRLANFDLGHRIRLALSELPEDQREVFIMRTEADISFKDIAKIQGTTLNTALSRMHYAIQKLRPLLQEDYNLLAGGNRNEK
jgi:RNA polymerase sigma-70 factor (ECF subfamily)